MDKMQNNTLVNNSVNNTPIVYRYVVLEDDICYDWDDYGVWGAVLFDVKENKVVTTKYGHGSDMTTDAPTIGLDKAIELNVVTVEQLLLAMLKQLPLNVMDALRDVAACHSIDKPLAIPVNVIRGRKFKGNGYLVYSIREHERYGLGAYQDCWNYYPMILDTTNNTLNKVNSFGYLKINEDVFGDIATAVFNKLEKTISKVRYIAHAWAYNMSYSACDTRSYYAMCKSLSAMAIPTDICEEANNSIAKYIEIKNAEREERMNAELPKLIEWVRSKGYKDTEEDIINEAKRIWKKNN